MQRCALLAKCERERERRDDCETTFGVAEAKGGNGESGGNGGKIEPTVPVYLVAALHRRCNTVFTGSLSRSYS